MGIQKKMSLKVQKQEFKQEKRFGKQDTCEFQRSFVHDFVSLALEPENKLCLASHPTK